MSKSSAQSATRTRRTVETDLWLKPPGEMPIPLVLDNHIGVQVGEVMMQGYTLGSLRRAAKKAGLSLEELSDETSIVPNAREINDGFLVFYNGALEVDVPGKKIYVNGSELTLAAQVYKLALLLFEHPGQTFSRDEIIELIWPPNYNGAGQPNATVRTHVKRLRDAISEKGIDGNLVIETVTGLGYKMSRTLPNDPLIPIDGQEPEL